MEGKIGLLFIAGVMLSSCQTKNDCSYEKALDSAKKSVEKEVDIEIYTLEKRIDGEKYYAFRFRPPKDSTGFSPVIQVYKSNCKAKVIDWV